MTADWGGTPLANATIRGLVAAIILGLLIGAKAYWFDAETVEQAIGKGIIPALAAILALLGYGAIDQKRANDGKVNASDVPVQIEAKTTHSEPKVVANTMERQSVNR
jgi:hypothetical protein